ncbi:MULTISPECIES: trans-aconitate 2-methyltransferase [unclassified Caballeronia]|jgi:trans-aconitate 2-methyltransferase|uniref:trans-aconitate 2-methyltransferase n=1 Tax=unclassified Caballeronia TaxID=2646786 RepID=UPI00202985F0|nr:MULTISPECIES: trans-aconitate 2-methyltransferase [unclassified Caballeronia]
MTTSSPEWQARQYSLFEEERTRPVRDLLNATHARAARTAVDLGCGPGNSTETLIAHAPNARVIGVDNSGDMIDAAKKRLPQVEFALADISAWQAEGPFDLILANAALQWVPDHETLFPSLAGKLAKGGQLAVQMPDNLDEPAHRLMREAAADGPWRDKLKGVERTARFRADWYYALLKPLCARVDVWRTTYHHPLDGGVDAIIEWFKGSALRPFLAKLDEKEAAAFLDRYRAGLETAYTVFDDGSVLLPFPRLFIVATR